MCKALFCCPFRRLKGGKDFYVSALLAALYSKIPVTSNLKTAPSPKNLRLEITQMKFTYLVYKEINGVRQLAAATQEEWNAILKENRCLPLEQRRRFIKDCIADGDEMDCMYIEAPASEHREWNSKNTIKQKKRKIGMRYTHLSLDSEVPDTEVDSLHECVPSEFNLEELVADQVLMEELKRALRAWNPWAEELLDLYIAGAKRSCTSVLCKKYQLSDRAVRKRKAAFEKFILDFLKK